VGFGPVRAGKAPMGFSRSEHFPFMANVKECRFAKSKSTNPLGGSVVFSKDCWHFFKKLRVKSLGDGVLDKRVI
jgi:hypothetical protein